LQKSEKKLKIAQKTVKLQGNSEIEPNSGFAENPGMRLNSEIALIPVMQ